MKKGQPTGPTPQEIKLRADLDKTRRELVRLKKKMAAETPPPAADAPPPAAAAGAAAGGERGGAASGAAPAGELESLRRQVEELSGARRRLSQLYANQLEEHRRQVERLQKVLAGLSAIGTESDLDRMLERVAELIREHVGFNVVLIRVREPGTDVLRARAFAGVDPSGREALVHADVTVNDFLSWLRDDFKISRSFFISHNHVLNGQLPEGHESDLGKRAEWEWHGDDVLLVPVFSDDGELHAYFSVDDPVDRLMPSRDVIELLEVVGAHTLVAIRHARRLETLEKRLHELETAGQHMHEMHQLKTNFVSTVSHELRTPVTAIRAYVDTLMAAREGEIPHARLQHFLDIINEESHRLARLIESVLDLSRFDSGAIRPARTTMDIGELLEETARVLQPMAEVGQVSLKVVRECADTQIDANRDQMRQLALHLGSNAVKFTPTGGAVTLRVSGDEREVTLQVEDTGIGIPEQSLEKIFERFYQVDSGLVRRYGGTGLGLAICRSIVEWHGGRILAESRPGEGSRFTVTLPRRTAPRVVLRPSPKPQAQSEDILKLAIELVAEVMNARVVSMMCPEPDGDLVIRAAIGLEEAVVREARIRPGTGVAGWVARNRRPVCVSGDEKMREVEGSGRGYYRSRTFLSVPLVSEGGLLGVLNVTDPVAEKPFDAEDCHLLLHLAERVAAAWEHALGMERSQAGVAGTAESLRHMLRHIEDGRRRAPDRVRLARLLAREAGLTESEAAVISFAASVHDVGMRKLGERLLEGGGALSENDRREVERHPEMSAELLRPLERIGAVREVVLAHHEWWDGTGYPRGLKGTAIPIGGRILAVVDAYESMTVGRAHRTAVSSDEAMTEIGRLAGKQFDPEVVKAFECVMRRPAREAGEGAAPGARSADARR